MKCKRGTHHPRSQLVVPFMQRAQEVQAADPKVAYYCRLYAVDQVGGRCGGGGALGLGQAVGWLGCGAAAGPLMGVQQVPWARDEALHGGHTPSAAPRHALP